MVIAEIYELSQDSPLAASHSRAGQSAQKLKPSRAEQSEHTLGRHTPGDFWKCRERQLGESGNCSLVERAAARSAGRG